MATTFGDVGQSIFGWFFNKNDKTHSLDISSQVGPTRFNVSRTMSTNKEDGSNTVSTSLSTSHDFDPNSLISSVEFTSSDTDNPSLCVQSNKLKHRNISFSASICEPEMTVDIGYNDQKKYSLELSVNSNFTTITSPEMDFDVSASMDSLMGNKLCIGGSVNVLSREFEVGAQYKLNEDTMFAVRGNDSLKNVELGVMKQKFGGTLYGRLVAGTDDENKPELDVAAGMRYQVDEQSTLDVMASNRDMINVRYKTSNGSGLSGYICGFINLRDARDRAKMQYGISFEA